MSLDLLGEGFDLHGGGQDLAFPHHENERAQAVALGKTFAATGCTTGSSSTSTGEKMSKSLGNFTNLLDLVEPSIRGPTACSCSRRTTARRSPSIATPSGAPSGRWRVSTRSPARTESLLQKAPDPEVLERFTALMDNDLDTPGAMALVFDTIRRANALLDDGDETRGAVLVRHGALDVRGGRPRTAHDR